MPIIKANTIIYGLFLDKDSTVDISANTTTKVIIGTSNARPKAKNIFITKFKKLLMSVAIWTPLGATLAKKLKINGNTT